MNKILVGAISIVIATSLLVAPQAEAQQSLAYAESLFEKQGIACESHLMIRGLSPGEDLVRFAEENGVDLVFVGVKRRSKVGKLLMGSTAQYVILNAPVPVMSIR